MNAILLRRWEASPGRNGVSLLPQRRNGETAEQLGYPRYLHLRDHARTVDGVAAWGRAPFTIATGGEGTAVLGNLVTANYFDVLGVAPWRGRFFRADENRTPGTDPVLVVSHAFWKTHLGGDAHRPTISVKEILHVIGCAAAFAGSSPAWCSTPGRRDEHRARPRTACVRADAVGVARSVGVDAAAGAPSSPP